MKKFDALLYLSSVAAGMGMIAANLFSVYDVSDFDPAARPVVLADYPPPVVVAAEKTAAPAMQEKMGGCADCLELHTGKSELHVAAEKKRDGRALSSRELGGGHGLVVPVSGAGVQR